MKHSYYIPVWLRPLIGLLMMILCFVFLFIGVFITSIILVLLPLIALFVTRLESSDGKKWKLR